MQLPTTKQPEHVQQSHFVMNGLKVIVACSVHDGLDLPWAVTNRHSGRLKNNLISSDLNIFVHFRLKLQTLCFSIFVLSSANQIYMVS